MSRIPNTDKMDTGSANVQPGLFCPGGGTQWARPSSRHGSLGSPQPGSALTALAPKISVIPYQGTNAHGMQCCGSWSVWFWASWIRNHLSEIRIRILAQRWTRSLLILVIVNQSEYTQGMQCCGSGSVCVLGLLDPDPFVRGTDPDPFIIKQK